MTKEKARAKWVEALRSGKYQQGTGRLKDGKTYCCLGVATDLFKRGRGKWVKKVGFEDFVLRDGTSLDSYLPPSMAPILGLRTVSGSFNLDDVPKRLRRKINKEAHSRFEYCLFVALAELNDAGVSFETIADLIEAEPEGLFEDEK